MNTKVKVVNDAATLLTENISPWEVLTRTVLSAGLVGVLFVQPTQGSKILFVVLSVYLFATAIVKWDPAYALGKRLRVEKVSLPSLEGLKRAFIEEVVTDSGRKAVNDPPGDSADCKRAG
jgi:hypothetical protein